MGGLAHLVSKIRVGPGLEILSVGSAGLNLAEKKTGGAQAHRATPLEPLLVPKRMIEMKLRHFIKEVGERISLRSTILFSLAVLKYLGT